MVKNSNWKNKITGIVLFLLFIIILVFLIRYLMGNEDIVNRVLRADKQLYILGITTTILSVVFSGLMDVSCARTYDLQIGYSDAIFFSYIAAAINIVLPFQMGSALKAAYYKKKSALSYSKYISVMAGTTLLNALIVFVMICVLIPFVFSAITKPEGMILVGVFPVLIIIVVWLTYRYRDYVVRIVPFKKLLTPILMGFFELAGNMRAIVLCSLNFLVCIILGGLRFYSILMIFDSNMGFVDSTMYFCLNTASGLIPVLPGNIGIIELFMGMINDMICNNFDVGVSVVIINRLYYYIVVICGAIIFAFPSWIRYRLAVGKKKD